MGLSQSHSYKMDPAPITDSLAVKSKSDYIPRKCCITNALLTSKDHASVQVNVGHVDQYGIYTGDYTVYCLSGAVRRQGEGDPGLNRLAVAAGFMKPCAQVNKLQKARIDNTSAQPCIQSNNKKVVNGQQRVK